MILFLFCDIYYWNNLPSCCPAHKAQPIAHDQQYWVLTFVKWAVSLWVHILLEPIFLGIQYKYVAMHCELILHYQFQFLVFWDFGMLFNLLFNVSGPGWCLCWSRTAGCIWYAFLFLFVSWYFLFPVWPIVLSSFDAHVNLEIFFFFLFSLLPKGQRTRTIPLSINTLTHTPPSNSRKKNSCSNICNWGFKFGIAR